MKKEEIERYCKESGAKAVWQSWKTHMQDQGREVVQERMNWDTLSDRDKSLDASIAYDILVDFMFWKAFSNG